MADFILPDGPGMGRGIRHIGPTDPGAVGAWAVWLELPVSGAPAVLHVRDAANATWLGTADPTPAVVPAVAEFSAYNLAPPTSSVSPGTLIPWGNFADDNGFPAAIPAAIGITYAAGVFTMVRAGILALSLVATPSAGINLAYLDLALPAALAHSQTLIPAAAQAAPTFKIERVLALHAGDTFRFNIIGTAAQQNISSASLTVTRLA